MKEKLFDKIEMDLEESFEHMTEEEQHYYYNNSVMDKAYIIRGENSVMGIIRQKRSITKSEVKMRIMDYYSLYSRMVPGFEKGEIMMRREPVFNMGVMTYKSNTPQRELFNVFSLMNLEEEELIISMSCDVRYAHDRLPLFTKMLQSIQYM